MRVPRRVRKTDRGALRALRRRRAGRSGHDPRVPQGQHCAHGRLHRRASSTTSRRRRTA